MTLSYDADGEPIQPPDEDIVVEWDGDGYIWYYADPDTQAAVESGTYAPEAAR